MLKSQANVTKTQVVLMVAPILPGKTEAWRRFIQELDGARRGEFEESRRRLGIRAEHIWISETRLRATGLILIEAEQLELALKTLATSADNFDCWFRERLLALQGIDLARPGPAFLPALLLTWQDARREPGGQGFG